MIDGFPASHEIFPIVRWLWGLYSWLSNSDSTLSTLSCALRLPPRRPDACRLFWTSPSSLLNFVQPLFRNYYKLPSVVTFTFIPGTDFFERRQGCRVCLIRASKFALFSMSGLKDEKLIIKQTYMKTETCKLYSRVFWIFCQISSKSIFIILSYTVLNWGQFLRHSALYWGLWFRIASIEGTDCLSPVTERTTTRLS